MIDFRPVLFIIGMLLITLSVFMVIPAVVDMVAGDPDWQVFVGSAVLTLFAGVTLVLTMRGRITRLTIRQAFLFTSLSWASIALFASLPLMFSRLDLSFTDAMFEAVSGITTTGSTVIIGLDAAPPGLLIWRALLQWLGGIGIIVTAIALLPMLQVGGMQLFRTEFSDRVSDKALPRIAQVTAGLAALYASLTAACAMSYWAVGMSGFDAVAHSMTTVATGGFSSRDASIGHYDSAAVDAVATVFMVAGALPFLAYLRAVNGSVRALWADAQLRAFLKIVAVLVVAMTAWKVLALDVSPLRALQLVSFNVVSIITGTGYATSAFDLWGPFAVTVFLGIMFIGGCAGSTSCGIKIFRFLVLYANARAQLRRLLQPHGVFVPYYNRRPIPSAVSEAVMGFFFLYILCFALLAAALGLLGLDLVTSMSGAATAISNVGPGLGPVIGPAGTFTDLPDAAKWLLAAGMFLGRLEIYTVLVLLAPTFWRS